MPSPFTCNACLFSKRLQGNQTVMGISANGWPLGGDDYFLNGTHSRPYHPEMTLALASSFVPFCILHCQYSVSFKCVWLSDVWLSDVWLNRKTRVACAHFSIAIPFAVRFCFSLFFLCSHCLESRVSCVEQCAYKESPLISNSGSNSFV